MASSDLTTILPRVLIVSRRTVRKNKFVDFVGEYHLDLIVSYGAVPVIVPRVSGVHTLLASFEPIHGVLLCEGEDIDPSLYESELSCFTPSELDEIRSLHSSDTIIDKEKDSIELSLAKLCLARNIPYLGICRGSQVLNVACGGTLYQDVEREAARRAPEGEIVVHVDYGNYDGHRHPVTVVGGTPLSDWFNESLAGGGEGEILVNSYHHQGVKRLADRFVPMALARDGLVEAFYDPETYDPEGGEFIVGLQFHPERMRDSGSEEFDYPGCPFAYKEFVKAAIAYQRKLNSSAKRIPKSPKMNEEMEKKRKIILRSFSIAKNMYTSGRGSLPNQSYELQVGAEFLQANTALSGEQEKRLKQMGATVRNASAYMERLKLDKNKERVARMIMEKMNTEQLSGLLSFYQTMAHLCSQVMDNTNKLHTLGDD